MYEDLLTFKSDVVGDFGRGVSRHDAVLGPGAVRTQHDMETHDSVALLELGHIAADLVDVASDIIALVAVDVEPLGHLPILGVGAGVDDLDEDLVRLGLRDGVVNNGDYWACV